MPPTTIHAGSRTFLVNPETVNSPGHPYIELGVAGTNTLTSTLVVQFTPSEGFAGDFVVMARTMGTAADSNDVPFLPVPYRVGNLDNVAQITDGQGWPWSDEPISTAALIMIPANGQSIVLMNGLSDGEMRLTAWDVNGNSAV